MLRKNKGSSLIEVMVALFILAIGLLGTLKMQIYSMQLHRVAYYNTQTSFLISQITDSIRSNKQVSAGYAIDLDDPSPVATKDCNIDTCNRFEMRDFDLQQWRQSVESTLPSGKSQIIAVDGGYAVTVQYDDGIHNSDLDKSHIVENTMVTQFSKDM